MKIKDMSWEELQKDFSKLLDKYTIDELVDSLDKYSINYFLEKEQFEVMMKTKTILNKKSVKLDSIAYNKIKNEESKKIKGEKLWKENLMNLSIAA